MEQIANIIPKTFSSSFAVSALAHVALYGLVVLVLGLDLGAQKESEMYLDLGYEVFEEPPAPAAEPKRVMKMPEPTVPVDTKAPVNDGPKEMQDEASDVAGTQKAAVEKNIGSESDGNASSTPYYKIKPKYPRAALLAGTEGWVLMQIDITEGGEVENVRVVDGEQRNTFQSEARRAVQQWKYRPFLDKDGKPVRKIDHQVRVDFKLTDAGGE
ncbi:MAG TPA: energy transducer TonB [Bdellovibrionales bacterium]|nr:energy transducer TonB [Bdellovibrionales bacterium]